MLKGCLLDLTGDGFCASSASGRSWDEIRSPPKFTALGKVLAALHEPQREQQARWDAEHRNR